MTKEWTWKRTVLSGREPGDIKYSKSGKQLGELNKLTEEGWEVEKVILTGAEDQAVVWLSRERK